MLAMARVGTADVARAKAFYDAVCEPLGALRVLDGKGYVGYRGPQGGVFIVGMPIEGVASAGNGCQTSFLAPNEAAVDAAYEAAISRGASCLGPPGLGGTPTLRRYAADFRDPDGNKVMVFHMLPGQG